MAFMQRGEGVTVIAMARVRDDGSLSPQSEWVRVSPREVKAASRPRFAEDGKRVFTFATREARSVWWSSLLT